MKFEVKKGQVDLAIEIMKEVAKWGRDKGYRVWLDEWLTKEALVNYEATEETFCVGYLGNEPACTMILQWCDKRWWPQADENEAAYIHKLCVRRAFAGKGLPSACLSYAIDECKRRGAKYVRLDTGWDEVEMKKLYKGLGFKIVDRVTLANDKSMALFEYEIGGDDENIL